MVRSRGKQASSSHHRPLRSHNIQLCDAQDFLIVCQFCVTHFVFPAFTNPYLRCSVSYPLKDENGATGRHSCYSDNFVLLLPCERTSIDTQNILRDTARSRTSQTSSTRFHLSLLHTWSKVYPEYTREGTPSNNSRAHCLISCSSSRASSASSVIPSLLSSMNAPPAHARS